MLKVLQICNKAPYPANDGSSIAIYNMARGLMANGVELHLLTINTRKNFKDDKQVPEQFRADSHYKSVYKDTNVKPLGIAMNLFSGQSYFVSRFYFGSFAAELQRKLKAVQFDVVQIEGLFMAMYIPLIRRHTKARIVLRAHNIEHYIWQRHLLQERSRPRRWYLGMQNGRLRRFELKALRQVDAVVTITQADELGLRKLGYEGPVHTCVTGIDMQEYARPENINERSDTVFYFGSMDWMPNQEAVTWFLRNCWTRVKTRVPSARLVIAGRGMPLEFYHIKDPGVIIEEEVENGKRFMWEHEVMVVPLWSGSGLRIKIIEGMACARPIVSTSIGAEGIPCTNGKDILIADSTADFSEAVIKLLRDKRQSRALGDAGAALVADKFDNNRIVAQLVDFYRHLIHA